MYIRLVSHLKHDLLPINREPKRRILKHGELIGPIDEITAYLQLHANVAALWVRSISCN